MTTARALDALASVPGLSLLETAAPEYAVDGMVPGVVARPADMAAISGLMRVASEQGLRVVPWGGGTAMDLGNRPLALDVVLDLSLLDAVIEYRPHDLTVTVQPGITMRALQDTLNEHGQIIALDPPLPGRATVGGTLAANASGPRRYRYGTARDLVIGASAVLADGSVVKSGGRVVKNVAGYDLNKLFIGSLGTLGIITQATFRLLPAPPGYGMIVAAFDRLDAVTRLAMQIYASTLTPLSLDLAGPGATIAGSDQAADRHGAEWLLATELGGTPAAVDRMHDELRAMAKTAGARAVESPIAAERQPLAAALRDFGRDPARAASLLLRAAVLPSQVGEAVQLLQASPLGDAPPAIVARAGNGIVLASWPEIEAAAAVSEVERLRGAIGALRGTLVVERCPHQLKDSLDVWGIAGPDVELMRRVKQVFDPAGVLAPGRGPGRI